MVMHATDIATDTVAVWFERSLPVRLVWAGIRFTVSDTPTPLRGTLDYLDDRVTHAPEPIIGWRFQGTSERGDTHIFDVRKTGRAEWELIKIYD